MDLSRVSRVWGTEFAKLVWGEEGVYKQQCLKTGKAVAEFLDNGEGRRVERQEEVKDDWLAQKEDEQKEDEQKEDEQKEDEQKEDEQKEDEQKENEREHWK